MDPLFLFVVSIIAATILTIIWLLWGQHKHK